MTGMATATIRHAAIEDLPMRISGDPDDQDFVGIRAFTVVLDRQFFCRGPVTMADEAAGVIEYYPVDAAGNYVFDPENGAWKVERVTGKVRIFAEGARC
jgi:hypothetical protein